MVRHNHERIAFNTGIMIWQFAPRGLNDTTELVRPHFAVDHFAEQTRAIPHHDRDEICASLRVIVSVQTN
jgi:hypothetical protein